MAQEAAVLLYPAHFLRELKKSQRSSELDFSDLLWGRHLVPGMPDRAGGKHLSSSARSWKQVAAACSAEPTAPLGGHRSRPGLVHARGYFWPLPRNKIEPHQVCHVLSRAAALQWEA